MFKNVQISFAKQDSIQLRWEWGDDTSNGPQKCNVFYCGIPENKLLARGIFTEGEILNYFNEQVLDIFGTEARQEMPQYNKRNPETSRLNVFQQGGHYQENKEIAIPTAMDSHIFLVCVYDEDELVLRVVAYSGEQVAFEIEKPGFLQKMRGTNYQTVNLKCSDTRKKVLVTHQGSQYAYSVLPDGHQKLYFHKDTDISGIRICYLSSLIGAKRTGED